MAKLTTTPIASGYASTAALNANFDLIEAALENTLSLDGTTPNAMGANLDMNGKHIVNIAAPTLPNDPVRLQDIQATINGAATAALVGFTPAGDIASTTVQTAIEELDTEKANAAATTTALGLRVSKTADTGNAIMPTGTTAQRATGSLGHLRYNTTIVGWEGYGASGWAGIGGGTTGGGTDKAFYENDHLITSDYTIGQATLVSGTIISIATPAVVAITAHGFIAGQMVFFQTTGALPTGLSVDTGYYIISTGLTADAFQLSLTDGGAAINTTGTQSGMHSCGKIKNAGTFGDVSVAAGVTITAPTGSTWSIS